MTTSSLRNTGKLIINENRKLTNLREIIWNDNEEFDYIWDIRPLHFILEKIHTDVTRCRYCFGTNASELIEVICFEDGDTYDMKLCSQCFTTHSNNLEEVKADLKERFFGGHLLL